MAALIYPYATPPAEGEWLEVASDIFWLRLPLPFALNHVHAWLLRDGNGWFMIDSGIGGARMRDLWDRIIAERLDGKPITRLLVTHYHPDHVGAAGYLWEKFQPEILMTEVEWLTARMLALDTQYSIRDTARAHYHALSLPPELIDSLTANGNRYAQAVELPPARYTPLKAGDVLTINGDTWTVLVGGGHSPAQISLYGSSRNIYISADQVLPRISPNVSVWASNPAHDALSAYLAALDDTKHIADGALILPSHDRPFYGLHERTAQLRLHHDQRLEQIVTLCRAKPLTIFEITNAAFDRPLDNTQMSFAIGEMLAHVNYLLGRNALVKQIDANNVWLFAGNE